MIALHPRRRSMMSVAIPLSWPRLSAFLVVTLFSVLIISQAPCAQANLMGVDLGLAYVKVSVARPGRGLELVTNEQAKRKTPAAVGFTEDGERLFGDAAIAYSGKAPARVVLDGRSLVGRCAADHAAEAASARSCPRAVVDVPGAGAFNGEELMAMLLGMARTQASTALDGATIKDVVVSVPAWFDERDRVAITDAARIVGLNCLGVINANTAAAVKYAIDGKANNQDADDRKEGAAESGNKPPKGVAKKSSSSKPKTQTVMFFDFGAGSATASIARIVVDGKTGATTAVKVLGHAWERDVGGRALDEVILEKMASDFDAQRGEGTTPSRELPRVMMRLRKEAQRVREILSANMETQVAVPSLYDDVDLRTIAKRDMFETGAEKILAQAVRPARVVLQRTGLSADDLDAVVPFGGASRTPKFQELLCAALGRQSLNKSINSDEAAVMGNAFVAASLSSTFRVRKIDIEDVFPRGISAEVQRDPKASGGLFSSGKVKSKSDVQRAVVFQDGTAKMPSKKTLNFKRSDDFSISIFLDEDKTGSSRFSDRTLYSKFKVSGVAKVLKKLKDSSKAKSLVPQVALTVIVDRSGLIRIGNAESSVDETVVVEREVEIDDDTGKSKLKDANERKGGKSTSKAKDGTGEGEEPEATESSDSKGKESGGDGIEDAEEKVKEDSSKNKTSKIPKKKKTKIEKSTQTVVHRQSLTVTVEEDAAALISVRMNKKELESSKTVLKNLEHVDRDRQERSESLNALEGFVLQVRSSVKSVDETDPIFLVSTEEDRAKYIRELDEAEDWMYTDEAKQAANLRKKLHELRRTYSDMEERGREIRERPASVVNLRSALEKSAKEVDSLRALHVERSSAHVDAFDKHDKLAEDVKQWLIDMENAQERLKLTDVPAFSSRDVIKQGDEVRRSLLSLLRLDIPPAPKPSPDLERNELNMTNANDTLFDNSTESGESSSKGGQGHEIESESDHRDSERLDIDVGSENRDEL